MENDKETIQQKVKAYKLSELAAKYGVDSRTFKKWLDPFSSQIGERIGDYFLPKQVKIIIECLGTWQSDVVES